MPVGAFFHLGELMRRMRYAPPRIEARSQSECETDPTSSDTSCRVVALVPTSTTEPAPEANAAIASGLSFPFASCLFWAFFYVVVACLHMAFFLVCALTRRALCVALPVCDRFIPTANPPYWLFGVLRNFLSRLIPSRRVVGLALFFATFLASVGAGAGLLFYSGYFDDPPSYHFATVGGMDFLPCAVHPQGPECADFCTNSKYSNDIACGYLDARLADTVLPGLSVDEQVLLEDDLGPFVPGFETKACHGPEGETLLNLAASRLQYFVDTVACTTNGSSWDVLLSFGEPDALGVYPFNLAQNTRDVLAHTKDTFAAFETWPAMFHSRLFYSLQDAIDFLSIKTREWYQNWQHREILEQLDYLGDGRPRLCFTVLLGCARLCWEAVRYGSCGIGCFYFTYDAYCNVGAYTTIHSCGCHLLTLVAAFAFSFPWALLCGLIIAVYTRNKRWLTYMVSLVFCKRYVLHAILMLLCYLITLYYQISYGCDEELEWYDHKAVADPNLALPECVCNCYAYRLEIEAKKYRGFLQLPAHRMRTGCMLQPVFLQRVCARFGRLGVLCGKMAGVPQGCYSAGELSSLVKRECTMKQPERLESNSFASYKGGATCFGRMARRLEAPKQITACFSRPGTDDPFFTGSFAEVFKELEKRDSANVVPDTIAEAKRRAEERETQDKIDDGTAAKLIQAGPGEKLQGVKPGNYDVFFDVYQKTVFIEHPRFCFHGVLVGNNSFQKMVILPRHSTDDPKVPGYLTAEDMSGTVKIRQFPSTEVREVELVAAKKPYDPHFPDRVYMTLKDGGQIASKPLKTANSTHLGSTVFYDSVKDGWRFSIFNLGPSEPQKGKYTIQKTNTFGGCCGAAYYNEQGKVFATHRYDNAIVRDIETGLPGGDYLNNMLSSLTDTPPRQIVFAKFGENPEKLQGKPRSSPRREKLQGQNVVEEFVRRHPGIPTSDLRKAYFTLRKISQPSPEELDMFRKALVNCIDIYRIDDGWFYVDPKCCAHCAAIRSAVAERNARKASGTLPPVSDLRERLAFHHAACQQLKGTTSPEKLQAPVASSSRAVMNIGKSASTPGFLNKVKDKFFDVVLPGSQVHDLLDPKFILMRPGKRRNMDEIMKFGEDGKFNLSAAEIAEAFRYVFVNEADCIRESPDFFTPAGQALCQQIGIEFCHEDRTNSKSAGPSMPGGTHRDFYRELAATLTEHTGKKHTIREAAIKHVLATIKGIQDPADAQAKKETLEFWQVIGKLDKYPRRKVVDGDGRTVQAPSIEMKIVWRYYMGASDIEWHKFDLYRVGESQAAPRSAFAKRLYAMARGVFATDVTGWDRRMPRELLEKFFMTYTRNMNRNMPAHVARMLFEAVCYSKLVMPDGTVLQKSQGNPSGFPATLRMNTVILRVVTLIMQARTLGVSINNVERHIYSEYCGDDCISFLLKKPEELRFKSTEELKDAVVSCWNKSTPWTVKDEGHAELPAEKTPEDYLRIPSMVSRGYSLIPGDYSDVVYTPCYKPDRVCAKLRFTQQPDTEEDRVKGTLEAIDYLVVEHMEGRIYVPAIDFIMNAYPVSFENQIGYAYGLGKSNRTIEILEGRGSGWNAFNQKQMTQSEYDKGKEQREMAAMKEYDEVQADNWAQTVADAEEFYQELGDRVRLGFRKFYEEEGMEQDDDDDVAEDFVDDYVAMIGGDRFAASNQDAINQATASFLGRRLGRRR